MSESMQTEPIGVLGGTTYQMGDFEECIHAKGFGVRGRYCLANIRYSLRQEHHKKYASDIPAGDFDLPDSEESVWEALIRVRGTLLFPKRSRDRSA